MNEIINISDQNEIQDVVENDQLLDDKNLASVLTNNLNEIKSRSLNSKLTMPIAEVATLGSGIASLLPAFRTVTQSTTFPGGGLYKLANQAVGDTLKVAKNGNFWGAYKTAAGTSKFVQLQEAGSITATTKAVTAINPATVMIAVALFSIEQKLGEISQLEEQILSFLETEKQAQIEADIQMLGKLIRTYKDNWDNEYFLHSNHKMVLDIQRTARGHINLYHKQISEALDEKHSIIARKHVDSATEDLLKKFQYYKLSVVSFGMASLLEVMLSGNFKEGYISSIESEINEVALEYRTIFTQCSEHIEKLIKGAIDANVVKGVGVAGKAVGKFIERIPVISRGQVDEFLQEKGSRIENGVLAMQKETVKMFASVRDPETAIFSEKLRDMETIFNKTEEICFDEKNVYLIA